MSKVILITGGAGFVGSALVRQLLQQSDTSQLVVVDNLFNGRRELLPKSDRIDLRNIDLRDGAALSAVCGEVRPDVVFHLAAIHFIPYCNEHPAETLDVNVTGTQQLLDALVRNPPQSLVIASSAAVYPIYDEAISEDAVAPGPTDIYGLSKWINERQLALFAGQVKTRCAAARLFNVYGPRETNPHILPVIIEQLLEGRDVLTLGNTAPKRDYVHSADVARALVGLAEDNPASFREYNVGTAAEYSVDDLVRQLGEASGRAITITTDPSRVRRADRMHLLCDRTRIEREIGWTPQYELRTGLAELWQASLDQRLAEQGKQG